jgi:WD40 repeat protein
LKPPGRTWFREGSSGGFSPDGKAVAVYSYQRGIYIWDCATATLKVEVALNDDHNSYGLCEFSPDGKLLAIYRDQSKGWSTTSSIEMRDSTTGELKSTLTGKNIFGEYEQRLWSADGQTYVSASGNKHYEGKIWDVKTGRLKATFPMVLTFSRIPFDFGFKNRDSLSAHPTLPVISASNDEFIRLWNSETGELMQKIDNTGGPANWSADGTLLLTFEKNLQVAHVWRVVASRNVS